MGLRVVPKSAGSENLDFTYLDALHSLGPSFKTADFQTEKSVRMFANLSLGLNYCSIGPSQPPSRDTVPLK
jgi:hypothetical protein